ncbi:MAG: (Fe-S)-binding protein [Pseudomonadota bacterium]
MSLAERNDALVTCNHCGFCQAVCPIFQVTGREEGVARGRVALMSALVEGTLPWSRELEDVLYTCLLCGACTAGCFPAVPAADLVLEARREFLEKTGRKTFHRLLFDHLLPYPSRLRLAARLVAAAGRPASPRLTRALGLLKFLGPDFPETLKIPGELPSVPLRDRLRPQVLPGRGKSLVAAYFVGCGMDLAVPEAGLATLHLLRETCRTVDLLPNSCCGLPPETYGDRPAARRLAEKNLKLFSAKPYDLIVTDCSSCAGFLKKYPQLFPEGESGRTARQVVGKIKDLVEILDLLDLRPKSLPERPSLTYHDPCHACRGQGLFREPRQALRALDNVDFLELKEADWCCGGAGSYSLANYRLARKVLDRKVDNILAGGAEMVVTSCPSCLIHLNYGLRERGSRVRALHLSQVLRRLTQGSPPG